MMAGSDAAPARAGYRSARPILQIVKSSLQRTAGPYQSATTRLMHRSNDEAMSSFRQAGGLQSPGGHLIAEFWA